MLAALLLAVAAVALAGLAAVQDALVVRVRDDRAGEAAVQAAGSVVADRLVRDPRVRLDDPLLALHARAAAVELAAANGAPAPSDPVIRTGARGALVELHLADRAHRVEVQWPCCRP